MRDFASAVWPSKHWLAMGLSLFMAGCGGRVSRPVAVTDSYDDQLDCVHLRAEKAVNIARARDLSGEQRNDVNNDIGFLLFSPVFLNLSGSEQTELRAFAARERVLDQLISNKCRVR